MLQRYKVPGLCAVVCMGLLLPACGAAKRRAEVADLKARVAELNRASIDQRKEIEDLKNKLFIVHDRVETVRNQMARQPSQPPPTPPSAPKLKVVRLQPKPAGDTKSNSRVVPKLIESYNPDEDEAAFVPAPNQASTQNTVSEAVKATRIKQPADDADPAQMYRQAFETLKQKNFSEAILQFDRFVKTYPNHDLADNALYWLGECYYGQGEHMLAIQEFRRVPELYPGGNKVPDALLKIGFAYAALGDNQAARRTLKQLVEAYPQSEATRLAQARLEEL